MIFKNKLSEVTKTLSLCAMGIIKADLVIKNARLVNVITKELLESQDVAIICSRIAYVGNADHTIGENTQVIDATGQIICPGFLDGHIHVESSMMTMREYAKAVIKRGTTGIYMDPHEICNVLGTNGVDEMIKEASNYPLKAMLTFPSCVPAIKDFEDSYATVTPDDIKKYMQDDSVVGLGEMMNFPGVIYGNEDVHKILKHTLEAKKIVTGHFSVSDDERGLNSYIASGVRACHESTTKMDGLTKMRLGMYTLIREGSAWHDLAEVIKAITEENIDTRYACLISDDTHPNTLLEEGHLDSIIKKAIKAGVDPITAIQMVTINTASCFKMDDEIGSITPSRVADIVFINNFDDFKITKVIIDGELVYDNDKYLIDFIKYVYPETTKNRVNLGFDLTLDTFKIKSNYDQECRVIEVIEKNVKTIERHFVMKSKNGVLIPDLDNDIIKVLVFERHLQTKTYGYGFVRGFNIKEGAVAQTIAHDAHNMLVMGTNDLDMLMAAKTLEKVGGGMVVVKDQEILALLELPVAGLMNDELDCYEMSKRVESVEKAWQFIGSNIISPFMTTALISLACLDELRLTNQGLVDCVNFKKVDLFLKGEKND